MRAQPLSKHPVHRRWPRSTAESRKRSRRGGNRWCSLRPPPSPPNSANSGSPGGSAWLRSKRAHRGGEGGGRRVLASSIVKRERGERASSLSLSLCRAWREVNVLRPLRGRTLFNNALLRTLTRYNGDSGEGCRRVCVCANTRARAGRLSLYTFQRGDARRGVATLSLAPSSSSPALYLCRGGPSVRGRFTKG